MEGTIFCSTMNLQTTGAEPLTIKFDLLLLTLVPLLSRWPLDVNTFSTKYPNKML